ncbi:hypothetical protein ABF66_06095 [Enterobacter roggenkampii]|nr:hypothetical protein [Cronobacter sakazakii]KJM46704.1 hypothetical protein SS30_20160 [Enterobacter roggenkampii]KJP79440.1 hypothetical protein SR65_19360 [Enterobacter roggenkampii]KLP39605.1 hypothetical protein ABF66_06095 [Enterobacter roggenkampii]KZQ21730.1 hypothetical protein A3461_00750 [Enterobacter roggenkampii]
MIIGNESHTTTAARILSPETIKQLQRDRSLMSQGWKILARWAVNQPAELQMLEAKGFLVLYSTLINQQDQEINALAENTNQGMSEQEQLELQGVSTNLIISD